MEMNRGRRLLLAVLQRTSGREVAARCRVTEQAVSLWVTGLENPSQSNRIKLEVMYRIDRHAWGASADPPAG